MCGRYASFREAQDLADIFTLDLVSPVAEQLAPSWNVAPTQVSRIVREEVAGGEVLRLLDAARWGLVPSWAKDPSIGSRMINARSETLLEKPSFKGPARYSRCVVPVEGYYEWKPPTDPARRAKTPYFIHSAEGGPLLLAGLSALWRDELLTFTICTRAARGEMTTLHDREPVMLPASAVDAWLNPGLREDDEIAALLDLPTPKVGWYEVSTMVNAVRNNAPDLVREIPPREDA